MMFTIAASIIAGIIYLAIAYGVKTDLINDREFDRFLELWLTLASVFWIISIPLAILYVMIISLFDALPKLKKLFGTMRNK